MQIHNLTRGTLVANEVREARTFWQRLRGWLGKPSASIGEGLYLTPCRSVHTLGMRFALDAVFVDRRGVVLAVQTLTPGCLGRMVFKSRGVLEVPRGACQSDASACCIGDRLQQVNGKGW